MEKTPVNVNSDKVPKENNFANSVINLKPYATLATKDGYKLIVSVSAISQSPALKMLHNKSRGNVINVDFTYDVMHIVVEYLYYKLRWAHRISCDPSLQAQIPPFREIPAELSIGVAMAAHYYQV